MKKSTLTILSISAFLVGSSNLLGQNITTLAFGSASVLGAPLYYSSSGDPFQSGEALASIGYFSGGSGFDSWVSLASNATFSPAVGFFSTTENVNLDNFVGSTSTVPQLAILEGINDPNDISTFNGAYALVSVSTWVSPVGTTPPSIPPVSDYVTASYDQISFGLEFFDAGVGGTGQGIQVVPEPATYAMLAGFAALAFVAIRRRK